MATTLDTDPAEESIEGELKRLDGVGDVAVSGTAEGTAVAVETAGHDGHRQFVYADHDNRGIGLWREMGIKTVTRAARTTAP